MRLSRGNERPFGTARARTETFLRIEAEIAACRDADRLTELRKEYDYELTLFKLDDQSDHTNHGFMFHDALVRAFAERAFEINRETEFTLCY